MNHIAPLLTLDCIELDSDITSRKRAFEEISHIFEHCAGVKGLDGLVIAILRTRESIAFDTPDNRRARLFFSVLIPESDPEQYLVVLSEISELLKDRAVKQQLLTLATPRELCEFISAWQPPEAESAAAEEKSPSGNAPDAEKA